MDGTGPDACAPPAEAVVDLGDLATADDVVAALAPDLFGFAFAVAGDRALAEDVVVEAIARTLPRLRRGGVERPDRYLRRAVANELTSRGRRRELERRQAHHGRATAVRDLPPGESRVDDRLVCVDLLRTLPVRQRTVLVLRFLEDRSVEEVAELLGTSVGTVKTHTSRGLDRLRRELQEGATDA